MFPKCRLVQIAAWGIVGTENDAQFNGRVEGCDQTPAAAERAALAHAVLAAHRAQVPVRLLIDNDAIVERSCTGCLAWRRASILVAYCQPCYFWD